MRLLANNGVSTTLKLKCKLPPVHWWRVVYCGSLVGGGELLPQGKLTTMASSW